MAPPSSPPRIVYCHCAFARVLPPDVKLATLEKLGTSGIDFECVSDLCESSARRDPLLAELAQSTTLRIAACYPRAVRGLFTAAGCALPANAEIVNLRVLKADEAATRLLSPTTGSPPPDEDAPSDETPADEIPTSEIQPTQVQPSEATEESTA